MLELAIAVVLISSQTYCFDKGISLSTYKNCKREVLIAGHGNEAGYLMFQDFLPIEELIYNGELLTLRIFFQGRSDFSVLLSSEDQQPTGDKKVFQTGKCLNFSLNFYSFSLHKVLAFGSGLHSSGIFTRNLIEFRTTPKCSFKQNIPNPMDTFYFEQVDMVVNKKCKDFS